MGILPQKLFLSASFFFLLFFFSLFFSFFSFLCSNSFAKDGYLPYGVYFVPHHLRDITLRIRITHLRRRGHGRIGISMLRRRARGCSKRCGGMDWKSLRMRLREWRNWVQQWRFYLRLPKEKKPAIHNGRRRVGRRKSELGERLQ